MSVINADYFTSLTGQVNQCTSCAQLQSTVSAAMPAINDAQAAATAQLAKITPMLALLTAPSADPSAIVTYLSTLISSYLTPQLAPSVTLAAQLTAQTAAITALTAAITSKASQFPSCSVTIP